MCEADYFLSSFGSILFYNFGIYFNYLSYYFLVKRASCLVKFNGLFLGIDISGESGR
jgi:hypothetical protein